MAVSPRVCRQIGPFLQTMAEAIEAAGQPLDPEVREVITWIQALGLRSEVGTDQRNRAELLSSSKDGPLTTAQAATVLGCSARNVVKLIDAGQLRATRSARTWSIERSEVESYLGRR